MLMRWGIFVCSVFAALTQAHIELRVSEFPPEQREEMRAIVEQVEKTCAEVFGVDVASITDNAFIEVHLNRTDYERADRDVANGAFRNGWSFATARAMQGHVALQPPLEYKVLVESGLPMQTKLRVANVAVYLCVYRAFEHGSTFPDWLRRGLSGHLAAEALRELGIMGALEDEPMTSTEIHTIRKLFEENPDYDIDAILLHESGEIPSGWIGSVRGAFVRWLMEIGVLNQILLESDRPGSGEAADKRVLVSVINAFADAGVDEADEQFRAWIDAFDPVWYEERRSLTTQGDVWFHSAFDRRKAMSWNKQTLGSRDWQISGSFKIYDREKTQMDVLFGYTDAGFMTVALSPEFGLKVFHCQLEDGDREKDKWVRLETKELRSLEIGEWADFKISKRRDRLIIKINRERPVMIDVKDIDLDGRWGLGCQYRSAGLWRDVVVD